MSESVSCSVMSESLQPHGSRLLYLWNFPGKPTGVDSHPLLQGIFLIQGSNPGLLHCRQILYHLGHQGNINPPQHLQYQGCQKPEQPSLFSHLWQNYSLCALILTVLGYTILDCFISNKKGGRKGGSEKEGREGGREGGDTGNPSGNRFSTIRYSRTILNRTFCK